MEHLAQDLSIALEESESCGSLNIINVGKWGMRRRTRSAGNLRVSHCLESDSVNEHSPARPNIRRKRKFKRMSVDETPMPPCGKRKRPQRMEIADNGKSSRYSIKIKPLHQSLVDKIEKFCHPSTGACNSMETQGFDENCEIASESSISWSGGEGHEGDDELTDWGPSMDSSSTMDQSFNDSDPREIRAGCRRLGEERPGFSINTSANERVAKFLQDTSKSELRLYGAERDKLGQLATLYSLDLWFESPSASLLRKTTRTPSMQPTQRHHSALTAVHKKIRTHSHHMIS
ncbi:uncharacterized protein LOC130896197 isoform X2 [Diorhabda carinulata]|uniref:uncharacterized protein LOC130449319 isoform X2 n=1 Tax=Diorhabda sublineata TaxID=1163346 RepID=UPI0024E174BF|nr:uncharacterized protein LOC130449319 isoform X2 [Diorhabda sublineata]XP_056643041.1 uncharacterized protein LOC130449319 isoform X2 [Diorhabda sublineata]XP_057660102.1 uncharacterized protein LOC130896197 isoform X2 [Diorhabda carinulata]XP_057660103.1 uncharacterized protein LOC130896197 isoform X2 [Diorhabda carinulata]